MGTHPPAGWYDDPTDPRARRFWDGDEWTPLVAGGDGAAAAPASGPATAPVPVPSRPRPARGWYADPADPSRRRYWDGSAWTTRVLNQTLQPESPMVLSPDDPAPASAARGLPLSPFAPRPAGGDPTGGLGREVGADTPSDTATAISDLMAKSDASQDREGGEGGELVPGRRRRTVVLAVGLLVTLVAAAAVTMTGRNPGTTRPDTGASAEVAATSTPPPSAPATTAPAVDPAIEVLQGADIAEAYDRCQDVVKVSPLSTDVRLVFQHVEDIAVDSTGNRTLLEFWVRERGDRDEDQRVAFVCLGGEDESAPPRLFMQI